jgi:hypothetical protein
MPDLSASVRTIREAANPDVVLEAVGCFLLELTPAEQSELPFGLRSELMRKPADIAMWALQTRMATGQDGVPGATYGRVCKLLGEAALRLAELTSTVD